MSSRRGMPPRQAIQTKPARLLLTVNSATRARIPWPSISLPHAGLRAANHPPWVCSPNASDLPRLRAAAGVAAGAAEWGRPLPRRRRLSPSGRGPPARPSPRTITPAPPHYEHAVGVGVGVHLHRRAVPGRGGGHLPARLGRAKGQGPGLPHPAGQESPGISHHHPPLPAAGMLCPRLGTPPCSAPSAIPPPQNRTARAPPPAPDNPRPPPGTGRWWAPPPPTRRTRTPPRSSRRPPRTSNTTSHAHPVIPPRLSRPSSPGDGSFSHTRFHHHPPPPPRPAGLVARAATRAPTRPPPTPRPVLCRHHP